MTVRVEETQVPTADDDAVVALMVASFQLGMDEPVRLRHAFDMLSTLVVRVPVLRLAVPADRCQLSAVVNAVLENAAR